MNQKNIRNFSIIAHIDHGKSTLADRILDITGAISERERQAQLLDSMDIERERGITIKLNAVSLVYHYKEEDYLLHLIDTPGHVDFSYEVSRSLAACEGAILVVDAAQGIEAQTLANLYLALDSDLTIIPVINKIDLPNANPEKVKQELMETLGFKEEEILLTSAKCGTGIQELVEAVVERIPPPKGDEKKPLKALIFDSYFDPYKGIVALIRIVDGSVKIKDEIKMLSTNKTYEVVELGVHHPKEEKRNCLYAGEVGFLCASMKSIDDVHVGDTITLNKEHVEALPGYKPMKPMVFCGLYPIESSKYPDLREALDKLKLNDASLEFLPETSKALGFGFRCGFLGLLHMEITVERIEREFGISLIATSPSVIYDVHLTDGTNIQVDSPSKMPDRVKIKEVKEPVYKTYFKFIFFTGVRLGESIALTFNDYDKGYIQINKTKTRGRTHSPKTKSSNRTFKIDLKLRFELLKLKYYYIKNFENAKGFIEFIKKFKTFDKNKFLFGYNKSLSESNITRYKNHYCKVANVKQIRIHDFRHSHITMCMNSNVSIKATCTRVGHKNPSTTLDIYTHLQKKDENICPGLPEGGPAMLHPPQILRKSLSALLEIHF